MTRRREKKRCGNEPQRPVRPSERYGSWCYRAAGGACGFVLRCPHSRASAPDAPPAEKPLSRQSHPIRLGASMVLVLQKSPPSSGSRERRCEAPSSSLPPEGYLQLVRAFLRSPNHPKAYHFGPAKHQAGRAENARGPGARYAARRHPRSRPTGRSPRRPRCGGRAGPS